MGMALIGEHLRNSKDNPRVPKVSHKRIYNFRVELPHKPPKYEDHIQCVQNAICDKIASPHIFIVKTVLTSTNHELRMTDYIRKFDYLYVLYNVNI